MGQFSKLHCPLTCPVDAEESTMTRVKSPQRCAVNREMPFNSDGLVSMSIAVYTPTFASAAASFPAPVSRWYRSLKLPIYWPPLHSSVDFVVVELDEETRYFITIVRQRLLTLSSRASRSMRDAWPPRKLMSNTLPAISRSLPSLLLFFLLYHVRFLSYFHTFVLSVPDLDTGRIHPRVGSDRIIKFSRPVRATLGPLSTISNKCNIQSSILCIASKTGCVPFCVCGLMTA